MKASKTYSRKVYISTNSTCNLNCKYCFENEKVKFEFNIDEALNILLEQLSTQTIYGTQISLRGGEPFMVFHKIKHLCESLWSQDIKEYYHIHITTNGTLIHGDIQKWLSSNRDKITLKLSLDGDRKSSEINRPKSFDLIDFHFLLNTWPEMKVNTTITAETLPYLAENIKFINSLGFKHITPHFSIMTDWKNCNLGNTLYKQLQELHNFYLKNPDIEPCSFFLSDISCTLNDKSCHQACNSGEMKAYDMQTRKYYPCYMCFPSIGGEKIAEEFKKLDFTNLEELEEHPCKACTFLNLCITCYAENYITRGSLSRRDMSLCKYQKIVFAVLFNFEYNRILSLTNPSPNDVLKMMAIKKHYKEIENILKEELQITSQVEVNT